MIWARSNLFFLTRKERRSFPLSHGAAEPPEQVLSRGPDGDDRRRRGEDGKDAAPVEGPDIVSGSDAGHDCDEEDEDISSEEMVHHEST